MERKQGGACLALVLVFLFCYLAGWLVPKQVLASAGKISYQVAGQQDKGNGSGDGGKGNLAKSFTIQDTAGFQKDGVIGNDHTPKQDFTVYVFVTNGGQTQNVAAPQDIMVALTLVDAGQGGQESDLGDIFIPQGSTYGSLTIQVPKAGSWYIQAAGDPGQGKVTVQSNIFLVNGSGAGNGLVITPGQATVNLKGNPQQQFTATWTFTLFGQQFTWDVTPWVTWTSSDPTVATIQSWDWWQSTPGLATGVAPGQTIITAVWFDLSATASLTVIGSPVPTSLTVSPSTASVAAGQTIPFVATLNFSDNSHQPVTGSASWSSSNSAVATVGTSGSGTPGLATGVTQGTVTITATYSIDGLNFSSGANLTVLAPVPVSLMLSPGQAAIPNGEKQQFVATLTYSDYSQQNVTTAATWNSSDSLVAIVGTGGGPGSPGMASALAQGTTTITAAYRAGGTDFTATGLLKVTPPIPVDLSVSPANATIAAGKTEQFAVVVTYSDNTQQDQTGGAVWSSQNTAVATVGSVGSGTPGLALGVAQGSTVVMANYQGLNAQASLTVTPPPIPTSLTLTPRNSTISVGGSQQFTAILTYSDNTQADVTTSAVWNSSNTAVATVGSAGGLGTPGLVVGITSGSAGISATVGNLSASSNVTVAGPAPPPQGGSLWEYELPPS